MTSKKIYCFGGDHHVNNPPTVSRMDVSTGKWEKVATMTSYRKDFASAQAGSKVYILGGRDQNDYELSSIEVFDCETHTWTQLGLMPQTRYRTAAVAHDGFIYVTGSGLSYEHDMYDPDSVIRYDIQNRKWKTMNPMEMIRYGHQLVVLNDRLYAINGCGEGAAGSVEEYNPETNVNGHWSRVDRAWNNQYYCFGATVNGGKIYILGDCGFEVYCSKSDKWTDIKDHHGTSGQSLVSVDDKLIATGGWKDRPSVYCYHVRRRRRRRREGRWSQLPDMDTPRVDHSSFVVDL